MNFLGAVKAMKEGKRITRPCWAGYIYMKNRRVYHKEGEFRNVAINSLEAKDWEIVDLDFKKLFQQILKKDPYNEAKIDVIRLNYLLISLNEAWAMRDMKRIKEYLIMIGREVRWKW